MLKILNGETPSFTAATQNYDFVHIDDIAEGFACLGDKGNPFTEYVIGSGNAKPLREFLTELQQTVSPKCEFKYGTIPFTGESLSLDAFDISPLQRDTGYSPQISFKEGIRRTFDWLKETI